MDDIILSIGGFYILLKFTKVEFTNQKVRMPDYIKWRYADFLFSGKTSQIDYVIKFMYVKNMRSLTSPEGEHVFINIYDQTSKTSLITFYHISLFQFDMILTHVLQDLLAENEGFIVHTSAVRIKEKAYCFMGRSGAGKSTIIRLLASHYTALSDDSGIIRKVKNRFFFYQMPLIDKYGKSEASSNAVSIGGICFLNKSEQYKILEITDKEKILKKLSLQLYSEKDDIRKQILSISELVNTQDIFYDLYFGINKQKMIELFTKL